MAKTCVNCDHCAKRHEKEFVNTSGRYVCLVLGSLIPDHIPEMGSMCTGLYFDEKNEAVKRDSLLSVTEAAEILGVTRQRVQVMLTTGKLDGVKVGNTWIVYRDSVNKRMHFGSCKTTVFMHETR